MFCTEVKRWWHFLPLDNVDIGVNEDFVVSGKNSGNIWTSLSLASVGVGVDVGVDKIDDKRRRLKTSIVFLSGDRSVPEKVCPVSLDEASGEIRINPEKWTELQRHLEATKGNDFFVAQLGMRPSLICGPLPCTRWVCSRSIDTVHWLSSAELRIKPGAPLCYAAPPLKVITLGFEFSINYFLHAMLDQQVRIKIAGIEPRTCWP